MRPPLIFRLCTSVLTRSRWASAPNWRVAFPSICQTPRVAGFNSASSQQCESSKLPDAGPKSYENWYRAISRNTLLVDALDVYRNPVPRLSRPKRYRLRTLARSKDIQLVVITAQHILRKSPQLDPRVRDLLCSDAKWSSQLHRLARKGFTAEDISYWAWTMISPDPDERVARFMSRSCHKPLFVLSHLLLKSTDLSPNSFQQLMEYCRKWYLSQSTWSDVGEAFDLYSELNPMMFNNVAENLCFHASRLQPDALPEIADLSVAYIKGISYSRPHPDKAYKLQCRVFNGALQAVSLLSKSSPYKQASQNWRAVTILLSLSSSLARPLTIEEESYRAIRQVLLALPKTASERDTASALSSSWPPYRILRDGMEEKADAQEYLSRVVKAGFMMQEAGYSKKGIDLAMDVLGGMAPDGSPTIQTRANYPRHLRAEQGTWAASIRATRNAQEAWAIFTNPPESGVQPTLEVYWEMMMKLAAAPANPGHNNLPGDGREVFPFDDRNLSDFEKARIKPPSIPQLLAQMVNAGVDVRGRLLAWLLRQAPNAETALDYIHHSSIDDVFKATLTECLKRYHPITRLSQPVVDLPHEILHAAVGLLCRLQPNRTANTPDNLPNHKFYFIHHAFRLTQTGRKSARASDRAPWESLMLALGRPNIMVSNAAPQDNDLEVVGMALKVLEKAEEHDALSLDMLDSFGQAIRKAVYSRLSIPLEHASSFTRDEGLMSLFRVQSTELTIPNGPYVFRRPEAADDINASWRQILTPVFKARPAQGIFDTPWKVIREASEKLKAAWRVLSTKASAHRPSVDSRVMAMHIYGYMRTLTAVGDPEEAALLLCWVVRDWAPAAGANLSPGDFRRLSRAVIVFRAFAEPLLDESLVAALREEIEMGSEQGGPVQWPTDQEVDKYIQGDGWGCQQDLHEVVMSAAASKARASSAGSSERKKTWTKSRGSCKIRPLHGIRGDRV